MDTLESQFNTSGFPEVSKDQALIKVIVPLLDGFILVIGLVGHFLVIAILNGRRKRDSQPPHSTDTLLLALSTADLLLLLCLPFHTSAITLGYWPFGSFLCKAISFMGIACSTASVFTLAALAVTRYLTVVHPTWAYRSRMHRRIKLIVALLWIPASGLAAPQFAFRTVTSSSAIYCFAFLSTFSQLVYSIALFLCGFAIPLGIIVLMYTKIYCFLRHARLLGNPPQLERYQNQVTHTSALLVLIFTLLWLPSYTLMFFFIGGTVSGAPGYNLFAIFARLLASLATVVNPILYGFMSQKFRKELMEMGRKWWAWCKSCQIDCPLFWNRDVVQPFVLDSSDRSQN
ncbi:delta-type opioid receptor-like [Periophthalmus magnuspinnatus]|uniref:G-protein coupled receptors family 1 profile domain-containing protein n=1 Tax=Periophthalmus magnuspinnatus TaxID=409849 RepID=A0A3B4ARU4_9GOBI|nr:delta-type opioid receptor-like [Periophthalmus magnuspinnatus]